MRCIAIGVALAATPRLGCRGVASPATGGWPRAASCQDKEHLGVTLARASARTKIIHTPGRQNPSLDHRLCKAGGTGPLPLSMARVAPDQCCDAKLSTSKMGWFHRGGRNGAANWVALFRDSDRRRD